jgi:hypothetical protein
MTGIQIFTMVVIQAVKLKMDGLAQEHPQLREIYA